MSDEVTDSENPVSKANSNGQGLLSGVSGGFEDDGQETFDEREVFTL